VTYDLQDGTIFLYYTQDHNIISRISI